MDEKLRPYATDRQWDILQGIEEHGGNQACADALGLSRSTVRDARKRVEAKAARSGYAPPHGLNHPYPDGFVMGKTTIQRNAYGDIERTWERMCADSQDREEMLRLFAQGLAEDVAKHAPLREVAGPLNADLLSVYPIGDAHLGMLGWGEEVGEDFDLDIARRDLMTAMERLVDVAPNSETAIILNVGDFFHADDDSARTRQSQNKLDVDTRWRKVMEVGRDVFIYKIECAARKHRRVVVRLEPGNHDPLTALALALILDAHFRDCPQVEIVVSPSPFWYFEFGKVLIGSTHGDKIKPPELPGIMAQDQAEAWGRTKFRYWYTGHVHHEQVKEYVGARFESFRTLAGSDAWHHASGYRSQRDMHCIVHHKDYGEIERHRANIQMIRDLQNV